MPHEQQIQLVLLDDDPGVLRALGLLLKAMQYSVTTFSSPVEALGYLRQTPDTIDVVLTDLRMPELSGAQVVSEIKRSRSDLPVIVMSGHASAADMQDLKSKGADGFIPKPFTPEQIATAVNGVVRLRRKSVGFA
jgi:two-component system C4-dicarboxylate transport response regulator DctD